MPNKPVTQDGANCLGGIRRRGLLIRDVSVKSAGDFRAEAHPDARGLAGCGSSALFL